MSAELRRAIVDFLRQAWWMWAIAAILQVLTATTLMHGRAPFYLNSTIAVGISLQGHFAGGGWRRIMCTLPLSSKDLGRLRWWALIGVPGAILSIAILTPLVAVPFIRTSPPIWPMLHVLARECAALGIAMLMAEMFRRSTANRTRANRLLSATTPSSSSPYYKRVLLVALFFALLIAVPTVYLGLLVITMMVPFAKMPHTISVLTAIGLVSAAYFFARTDPYIVSRPISLVGSTKKDNKLASGGLSGWLVIARQQATLASVVSVAIIIALYVFHEGRSSQADVYTVVLAVTGALSSPTFWLPAARAFRALPVTSARLTSALMLTVLAPMIVTAAVLYGVGICLHWINPSILLAFLLPLAASGLPLALRFSSRRVAMLLAMIPIFVGIYLADRLGNLQSPTVIGIELGVAALLVAVSYAWTKHELTNGTYAYRPRPTPATSFGGGLLPR